VGGVPALAFVIRTVSSLTTHRSLLRLELGDLSPLGLCQWDSALIQYCAASVTEIVDCALRREAIAVRFVDRVTGDPQLITA
jgi:hypothetical protein